MASPTFPNMMPAEKSADNVRIIGFDIGDSTAGIILVKLHHPFTIAEKI
jgi:hypothetical protein